MKLKDLKQGMVCKLRNKEKITVVDYGLFAKKVEILTPEINYNNGDFTHKKHKDLDIKKITYSNEISIPEKEYNEDFTHRRLNYLDIMEITYGDKVVFKRNESRWYVPEYDEEYFYTTTYGGIGLTINTQFAADIDILNNTRVFKTREEVDKRLKQQQTALSVERWIAENDVEVDICDTDITKYCIVYDIEDKELGVDYYNLYIQAPKQFILSSEEKAEQLIEEREKELKIMLGVEE